MKPFLSQRPRADLPPLTPADPSPAGFSPLNPCAHSSGEMRPAEPRAAGRVTPPAGTPRVDCVRQGDKVVRIVVTCGCGERIEIDCLYPAGG